jgi:hypothetical protein
VSHLLRHGTSVFKVIFERPVILTSECRALGEGAITTYFKRLRFDATGPSGSRTHDLQDGKREAIEIIIGYTSLWSGCNKARIEFYHQNQSTQQANHPLKQNERPTHIPVNPTLEKESAMLLSSVHLSLS